MNYLDFDAGILKLFASGRQCFKKIWASAGGSVRRQTILTFAVHRIHCLKGDTKSPLRLIPEMNLGESFGAII
jgi:hypothetical protein